MENQNSTPVQNTIPEAPMAAPIAAPVAAPMVAQVAAPEQPAAAPMVSKASHRQLYVLLAVFAVMGGTLAAIGALKPDMITSTFAWVTHSPTMHAASSETKVLVNGQWVSTSTPEAELVKEKKPEVAAKELPKEETKPAEAVVAPEAPATEPVVAPEAETTPAENAEVPATAVAPEAGVSVPKPESQPTPVAPATVKPSAEPATK